MTTKNANIDNIIEQLQLIKEEHGNITVATRYKDDVFLISGLGILEVGDEKAVLFKLDKS